VYFLLLIFGGVLILYLTFANKTGKKDYLNEFNQTILVSSMDEQQAVDIKSLSDQSLLQKIEQTFSNVKRQIGRLALVKIMASILLFAFIGSFINSTFFRGPLLPAIVLAELFGLTFAYLWLQKRERTQFEDSFPDALNMLSSAVSAGESLMHSIMFVGKSLDGELGKEFALMGERLQMGETPDSVFRKSCHRFPYPTFHFFVITLRANMQRGGQLKGIMARLNRLMFDARTIKKKKGALTAEARSSAKIVGAIPFVFLFMLQFLSPENFEFVMFHPGGRPILYYVLISESIGMFIIWLLMRGVK